MAGEVAVDDVSGVGMRIEMDDADIPVAEHVGHGGGSGPGDRVIPAEHKRHDAASGDLVDTGTDIGVACRCVSVRTMRVTEVDDVEMVEDLDAEIEVVRARLMGSSSDRSRTESGPGAIGGREVEWGADHCNIGTPPVEILGIGHEGALGERLKPAEYISEFELLPHTGGEEFIARVAHIVEVSDRRLSAHSGLIDNGAASG